MTTAMRYFAKLKGQEAARGVDVEPLGAGRFALTLDGKRHEVDALTLPHGTLSLIIDGRSYSVEFDEHGDDVMVWLRRYRAKVDIADERQLKLRAAAGGFKVEGKQVIVAPMPGKVVKLLVRVGDEVEEGQGLIVVEAMKMENELKSPKKGKVTELYAQEGSAVENNAKLLAVE